MGYHKYSVSRANSVIVCALHLKRHATCTTFRVVQSCLPDGVACSVVAAVVLNMISISIRISCLWPAFFPSNRSGEFSGKVWSRMADWPIDTCYLRQREFSFAMQVACCCCWVMFAGFATGLTLIPRVVGFFVYQLRCDAPMPCLCGSLLITNGQLRVGISLFSSFELLYYGRILWCVICTRRVSVYSLYSPI